MIFIFGLVFVLINLRPFSCTGNFNCNQLHLGHLGHGIITSYNFPFDYHHNLSCTHRIQFPDNFSKHKICFTFYRFSLETNTPYCYFDNLKVKDTKYCGLGNWQFGYQEDEKFSNLFEENFCWSITKNTFDVSFQTDNSVTSSGFYATYEIVEENAVIPNEPTKQDYAPCSQGYWTCFNRKCILEAQVCNGPDNCGDGSDESYAHARCGEQNVLACDFSDLGETSDGYCGFTHEGWYRTKEKIVYGTSGDHTNGTYGHYVYTDTDLHYGARLLSPEFTPKATNKTHCLSFWYYMYGNPAEAVLDVFIRRDQTYNRPEWSRRNAPANQWLQGQITFISQPSLQVIFSAKLENNFSGVALDDISILEGVCSGADIGCNFESSLCGWTTRHELQYAQGKLSGDTLWKLHKYQEYPAGPNYDYSSRDGGGYYTYINYTGSGLSTGSSSHRALLISPPVSYLQDKKKCLQFHYNMLGKDENCCVLKIKLHSHENLVTDALWSRNGEQRDDWLEASLQIEHSTPYQIVIEGWVSKESQGEIAIDQIVLQSGDCQSSGGISCGAGQYLCAEGSCIDAAFKCDGTPQCRDGSDEDFHANCPTTTTPVPTQQPTACSAGQVKCRNEDKCIDRADQCDGFTDCQDGSDESPQLCATVPVTTKTPSLPVCSYHRCEDGQCVETVTRCNGVSECRDHSDEANCTGVPVNCLSSEFECKQSGMCIARSRVCDYQEDCTDGSDEETCAATVADPVTLGAGPAVGIALGILAVIIVVILVFVFRKRQKKQPPPHSDTCLSTISYNSDGSRIPADVVRDSTHFNAVVLNRLHAANSGFPNGQLPNGSAGQSVPAEEAPPPYDSVVKEQTRRSESTPDQSTNINNSLSEWTSVQRNSVHRNTLPSMSSVHRNQSWRGGSSRHARVPNNNPQAFVSGLDPRPIPDNMVDHSHPHLANPYAVRNYVPDPTVNSHHDRVDSRNTGVRRSAQRIPGIYPDGPHRFLNRQPKLGTTALSGRRRGPPNYINQHSGSQSGYESDSTVPTEPIYETLNLPSDSDRESHTLERRPRSSYLPRDLSSNSVNVLFNANPHMNSDSSTTIRPVSVCTHYPSGGYPMQERSPTHMYSPHHHPLHSPTAGIPPGFQHLMGSPHAMSSPLPTPGHVATPSGDSQLTVPSSSGYGSYNGQPMLASPGYNGQGNGNLRNPHQNSQQHHHHPAQAGQKSKNRTRSSTSSQPSENRPARQDSSVSQGSGDKEHRSTPDSQSKLLPSSNNSSFDQTCTGRNDPNLSGIIFLPDMEQRLLNPTSV